MNLFETTQVTWLCYIFNYMEFENIQMRIF